MTDGRDQHVLPGTIRAGESVLLIDRKQREYLRRLTPGASFHMRGGTFETDSLIGLPDASYVESTSGERFLMLRPTYAQTVPKLPRRAQVIYPKDTGLILLWGDITPGARVLEVGTGPGALTIALLRAVGPGGHVYSYEIREEFAAMARANVEHFFGPSDCWTLKQCDVREGISERDLDRIVVDLAQPWDIFQSAYAAMRPGAVLTVYVPTVVQVKQTVDSAQRHGFAAIETMESLVRFWNVDGLSVRPQHRMVAHTGFVITCRRLAEVRDGSP